MRDFPHAKAGGEGKSTQDFPLHSRRSSILDMKNALTRSVVEIERKPPPKSPPKSEITTDIRVEVRQLAAVKKRVV